ncbi:hypothetical protein K1719_045831 [Acacia pycnantha]|nr:hypothetical protein K1719_045831 [Acacia pycnantha]
MQVLPVESVQLTEFSRGATVIGSINGLVCVKSNYKFLNILVWNPAISKFRLLTREANLSVQLGFGFCSIVKDTRFTNGAIFWFGFKKGNGHLLVSYCIETEEFALIPSSISPPVWIDSFFYSLSVYENKLDLLSHTTTGNNEYSLIDLWVMEEGKHSISEERWSWTKKYSIEHPYALLPWVVWRNMIVCDVVSKHEVVDRGLINFVLVNLTTDELKSVSGIGGGAHFIPILTIVAKQDLKTTSSLSSFTVTGGSIANVMFNLRRTNSKFGGKSLIDYDIALSLEPSMLLVVEDLKLWKTESEEIRRNSGNTEENGNDKFEEPHHGRNGQGQDQCRDVTSKKLLFPLMALLVGILGGVFGKGGGMLMSPLLQEKPDFGEQSFSKANQSNFSPNHELIFDTFFHGSKQQHLLPLINGAEEYRYLDDQENSS